MGKEPQFLQLIEKKKNELLQGMINQVPYIDFLGVKVDRLGDELTSRLIFKKELIGNPVIPAIHGGAIGSFLEITAIIELAWALNNRQVESTPFIPKTSETTDNSLDIVELPKTIDFTIDYLNAGLSADAYARAIVNRVGRRYASVSVSTWQFGREKPFAQALGHFLIPSK